MRQVITINLHNNAYQVEDEGFRALQDYLSTAEHELAGNPDCTEILADLEQAIAEKCDVYLSAHKNVVTAGEVARILREMGPVTAADSASPNTGATSDQAFGDDPEQAASARSQTPTRRLFRLEEGKLWGGVCSGLAAYLGIDVVWVRVVWVLITPLNGPRLMAPHSTPRTWSMVRASTMLRCGKNTASTAASSHKPSLHHDAGSRV